MKKVRKLSELQYLENYRLLFSNLESVEALKTEMAEYGYNEEKIAKGKALYDKTKGLYEENKQETAEEREAYANFAQAYEELKKGYKKHRKIAKVALMKNTDIWRSLAIDGSLSQAYLKSIEEMKTLYTQAKTHTVAKPILQQFKLTESIANQQLESIEEVEALRAKYEKEKGESQDATQQKNKAFEALAEWVREFYAIAEIALEDHPQLLESIGKFVRS